MKNISIHKQRILQYLEIKGINKRTFYSETGVSNGVLDKVGGLTMETVEKIYSTYKDLNLNWFITGIGNIIQTADYKIDETPKFVNEPLKFDYNNYNDLANYIMDNEELLLQNKRFKAWHNTVFLQGEVAALKDYINTEIKKATSVASASK